MNFFKNNKGWPCVDLGEIATLQRGYDLPVKKRTEGAYIVYAANGPHGTHCEKKVKGPGVITGRSGTIGKVHFSKNCFWPLNTSLYVKDFHGNDPRWVFYMLQNFRLERFSQGAGVPTLNRNLVHGIKIPLPPLPEQKYIVAILDKADTIRRKRQQAIKLADDFLCATFLDMFGDPVTNPKGWEWGTIRELVSEVKYGTSQKADIAKGNYPILRMNNITYGGRLDISALKYITLTEADKEKYLAQKGDLLFNRTNSKELVGKTAVYNLDYPMAIAGYLIRVRANKKANSHYISGYLNSTHGKQTLLGMCKSIIGMANINAQELQDIRILKPPPELQIEYAQMVYAVEAKKLKLIDSLKCGDQLFNALTQQAFRGKL